MAIPIQMPSLSPTMTEGKIVKWLKKQGDKVSSGDAVAEVETDKSNLEIEAYDDGYLLQVLVGEGEMAKVGAPIAYIGAKGEKVGAGKQVAPAAAPPEQKPQPAPAAPAPQAAAKPASSGGGDNRIAIQMPSLSPTMTEGKIVKWLKKQGDKVSSGDAVAEVETDKSNLEIEAYDNGTLAEIVVGENQMAKVGAPIAYLTAKGAKAAPAAPAAQPKPPAPAPEKPAAAKPAAAPAQAGGRRLRASPVAKRIAREKGLDLTQVSGSGPSGRVVKRDIEEALARGPAAVPAAKKAPAAQPAPGVRPEPTVLPLSSMRKVIAQRMTEVKPGVPHFYLTIEVDMEAASKVREEAKAMDLKVSVNDLIVKAVAMAVRRYPKINVSLQGDKVVQFHSVDVGIAVALEEGLITPILRDADQKGLQAIASGVRELAERARKRALKPEEYTGGSITVSNLGMYGIDQFVAVINPPQASILAVGAVSEKAVVRDGQLAVRKMMTATLSCDHRVIDGAIGAEFLRELRGLLEHPTRLLF
ncbi:pyruvate dehydrogenase complex, E2 component, dihydrolipoamide acetyltransferase [Myxococcus xanthus DK 1622]|uniref:Acetyltransferase component of pyruvate dehydrogenase complex n=1 Tax=Myxococcus xanthus (strain DK1622) TaxID=246197 RepID=Q1D8Y6_MYXXD|nr:MULTISPECIES: pyruvate dehydrogenase complex dihydrolipoamide acetyltransferase [Myxococcus]ABF88747.1 pyruvate dehydrogenase complex, E2 component, dihydrolipoamide acetyltransferase [Myxococcus xanthus DK 1622]NOJ53745.1 pyruvate dehydrogenase complex dihydrolipoamide acetyltransferase [Myxococcus xanthus]QPM82173.1 pyruvate dehydrogenase complex dihydrolipoamide acetyltransferase [Myxococcus xanthus]QVW71421.1 pyruvate dehydrogenase complex dihydrolipoamide acetyltransferase [Myxococcus x